MLKAVTAQEMQQIDRLTTEKYGIAGCVLMERAGLAVVSRVNDIYFHDTGNGTCNSDKKIIVLCGGGNNGGDGFVIARILHNQRRNVVVYLTARPENLKGDARTNYNAAKKYGVRIYPIKRFLADPLSLTPKPLVIIDALLGTGLNKDVRPPVSDVILKVNDMSWPVISVDVPSGISSDTGQIMGCAIKAHATVTFGLPKRGHYLFPGAEHSGSLFVEDIGFPQELLASGSMVNVPEQEDIMSLLPKRPKYSHKGTYGHVLLIAGSKGKTGAALMAAKACLRTGAGLVTIGIPETMVNAFQSRVTEEMILPLPEKGDGTLSYAASGVILKFIKKRAKVLAIGPGLSVNEEISKLVSLLISEAGIPIVIDADGLNAVAGRINILGKARSPVILTPHVGEMARLISQKSEVRSRKSEEKIDMLHSKLLDTIERDRINTALSFTKRTKTHLVLKGVPTIIATADGNSFINPTGNPGMATAGTGDVLTGVISALLAQRLSAQDASVAGVYLHGLTGDIAVRKKGEHSLVASDIIQALPEVFKMIRRTSSAC
ncbi:MAG: NAD(P)H-hydrate dehydratase [Nitrospiraceae bacterium]|nr:MAG: NAD(P)H-hydrate dehydratase [Nitrospiraceae bacterium]